jgi:hypothetical protein
VLEAGSTLYAVRRSPARPGVSLHTAGTSSQWEDGVALVLPAISKAGHSAMCHLGPVDPPKLSIRIRILRWIVALEAGNVVAESSVATIVFQTVPDSDAPVFNGQVMLLGLVTGFVGFLFRGAIANFNII